MHHIVAMPFFALGHINPMMNLCKLLASKTQDILITFVIEEMYAKSFENFSNIRVAYIPNNILPSQASRMADVLCFGQAMAKLEAPFEQILDSLQVPPVNTILIDCFLPWAVHVGSHRNIPVATLWTTTITEFCMYYHMNLFKEKQFPTDLEEHANGVVDFIPAISPLKVSDLPRHFIGNDHGEAIIPCDIYFPMSKIQYLVCASIYELESQVFDFLRAKFNFPLYPFGPLISYFELNNDKPTTTLDYIEWLNSQPTNSVMYVSMGTTHSLSSTQIDEMAAGLRSSGVPYLWAGRENTSPLKDECGELGMVVPWCDQMEVLRHSSVGGFLTHCGMSSTLEAGFSGVPMLTFPICGDQFVNCKLIVEDWKVGWRLRAEIKGNKLITREVIAKIVQKFMDMNGSERRELTENAKQFQEILKGAITKGGSSDANFDAFLQDITQGHAH